MAALHDWCHALLPCSVAMCVDTCRFATWCCKTHCNGCVNVAWCVFGRKLERDFFRVIQLATLHVQYLKATLWAWLDGGWHGLWPHHVHSHLFVIFVLLCARSSWKLRSWKVMELNISSVFLTVDIKVTNWPHYAGGKPLRTSCFLHPQPKFNKVPFSETTVGYSPGNFPHAYLSHLLGKRGGTDLCVSSLHKETGHAILLCVVSTA